MATAPSFMVHGFAASCNLDCKQTFGTCSPPQIVDRQCRQRGLSDGEEQSRALKDFKESLKAEQMQQYVALNLPKWVPKNAFVGSNERMHVYPNEFLGQFLVTCIEKPLTTGFSMQCNSMGRLRNIHMGGCLMPVKSNKY